jgi:hypothetical protein
MQSPQHFGGIQIHCLLPHWLFIKLIKVETFFKLFYWYRYFYTYFTHRKYINPLCIKFESSENASSFLNTVNN